MMIHYMVYEKMSSYSSVQFTDTYGMFIYLYSYQLFSPLPLPGPNILLSSAVSISNRNTIQLPLIKQFFFTVPLYIKF